MNSRTKVTIVAALLLVAFLAGSVAARQSVERLRGSQNTLEEVLYMPSGNALKRMSLGYSSLLADIYWTRAVQYFGSHYHEHSTRYDLLAPLLDVTTDLDPHLIVAYETGSIFLSQKVPFGAGQPDKAVALLEKGIRENPEAWRLYFTLGFVHYVDRRDWKAAQDAFERGSRIPGSMIWMKVMAARMAEHSGDITTAIALWDAVRYSTNDKIILDNANNHSLSLRADAGIDELERKVQTYASRTGTLPHSWSELVRAGVLPGLPLDPNHEPFILMPDGTVQVQDPTKFKFLGEFHSTKTHREASPLQER